MAKLLKVVKRVKVAKLAKIGKFGEKSFSLDKTRIFMNETDKLLMLRLQTVFPRKLNV